MQRCSSRERLYSVFNPHVHKPCKRCNFVVGRTNCSVNYPTEIIRLNIVEETEKYGLLLTRPSV